MYIQFDTFKVLVIEIYNVFNIFGVFISFKMILILVGCQEK